MSIGLYGNSSSSKLFENGKIQTVDRETTQGKNPRGRVKVLVGTDAASTGAKFANARQPDQSRLAVESNHAGTAQRPRPTHLRFPSESLTATFDTTKVWSSVYTTCSPVGSETSRTSSEQSLTSSPTSGWIHWSKIANSPKTTWSKWSPASHEALSVSRKPTISR